MTVARDTLYALLPEFLRYADYYQGEPLRALLSVLERPLRTVDRNLDQLYDAWFVETCEEWLIPYLGDLVGVTGLAEPKPFRATQRSRVANTLGYRRRKGTAEVVARVARDVTAWPCQVVEVGRQLVASAHLETLRPERRATVDLADPALAWLGGPFSRLPTTADLTRPGGGAPGDPVSGTGGGPFDLALTCWRLESYPALGRSLREVSPAAGGDVWRRATFHPFGLDTPLFNRPRSHPEATVPHGPNGVPGPLDRRTLAAEIAAAAWAAPPTAGFETPDAVSLATPSGEKVRFAVADLSRWQAPGRPPDDGVSAWVDPVLGRALVAAGEGPLPRFDAAFGLAGDLGGGPYERRRSLEAPRPEMWTAVVDGSGRRFGQGVGDEAADHVPAGGRVYPDLASALSAWEEEAPNRLRCTEPTVPDALIRLAGNPTWTAVSPGRRPAFKVRLARGQWLVLQADPASCPALVGDLVVEAEPDSSLTVNGLWIDGSIVLRGPCDLTLAHTTVRPGSVPGAGPALVAEPPESSGRRGHEAGNARSGCRVALDHAIVGRIELAADSGGFTAVDSVLDGGGGRALSGPQGTPGPPAALFCSTVLGSVHVAQLPYASNCLFTGPVEVEQVRFGELRHSFVPRGSRTPRRTRCQPDEALAAVAPDDRERVASRLVPSFTASAYGRPGYAQLGRACPPEIARGADDGSEMGAFHDLYQPQREIDLAGALQEYAPWGYAVRIHYAT